MKTFRIRSHYNCNSIGTVRAASETEALEMFHAEMFPTVLDVYAEEISN